MIYGRQRKFDAAEKSFRRALAVLENAHGKNAPELGLALQNYSQMLRDAGRPADAERIEGRIKALRQP